MTSRCWWSARLAPAASCLIVAMFTPSVYAGDLSRVKYLWLDREVEVVGEINLPEDGGQITLRLFSEQLSEHYTIYLEAEELLSVRRLPTAEAKKISDERQVKLLAARAKRDLFKAERKAERERKKALERERERKGFAKASRRGRKSKSKSKKSTEGRYVGRRLPGAHGMLQAVDEDLQPLEDLLARLDVENDETIVQLESVVDVDRTYRPARQLLGEFEDLADRIDKVSRGFERLVASRDRLADSIDTGDLKRRDLDDKMVHIHRLIARYDAKIRDLDASHREFAKSVSTVTRSATAHHAGVAAERQAENEREARAAAKRQAKRDARRRERDAQNRPARTSDDAGSVGSAADEESTAGVVALRANRADDVPSKLRSSAVDDDVDDEASEEESGIVVDGSDTWIPFAWGGLALAITALFLVAARGSSRREFTPAPVDV